MGRPLLAVLQHIRTLLGGGSLIPNITQVGKKKPEEANKTQKQETNKAKTLHPGVAREKKGRRRVPNWAIEDCVKTRQADQPTAA
jgi:hypothetical protein